MSVIIELLFVFVEAVFVAPRSDGHINIRKIPNSRVIFPPSFPGRISSVAIRQWPLTPVSAQRIYGVIL